MKKSNILNFQHMKAASQFEKALANAAVEEQLAAALVAENLLFGASWAFCRADEVFEKYEGDFRKSENCSIQKITYNPETGEKACLVYITMGRILELLGPDNGGPLTADDLALSKKMREESGIALIDRLKSGYVGKIAIYYINDTMSVTVNGETFPAYTVSIKELCHFCARVGYGIVIGGIPRDPMEVLKREDAVLETLLLTPGNNGLFIEIAPMKEKE